MCESEITLNIFSINACLIYFKLDIYTFPFISYNQLSAISLYSHINMFINCGDLIYGYIMTVRVILPCLVYLVIPFVTAIQDPTKKDYNFFKAKVNSPFVMHWFINGDFIIQKIVY